MNAQIRSLLDRLEQSSSSSAIAVVDHIRTVAANGPEYSTPRAVKEEAEQLAAWASQLAKDIKLRKDKP